MSLSEKEKKYLEKIVNSNGDLDLELIIEVINKKRDDGNKIDVEIVSDFLEQISSSSDQQVQPNNHIKQAEKIKYSKNIEELVSKTTHITAGVLDELLPAINEILKPKKPKKYKILSGKTQAYLDEEVNRYIKNGWHPLGGVSAAAFGISPVAGNQYIQAVVKY